MINKYLMITLLILCPSTFITAQTLELYGKKATFGTSFSEQKNNFWQEGGQLESEYSYIEIYEGDNVNGCFYKNHLITLYVSTYNKNVCDEIESLLINIKPYNQYTENKEGEIQIEIYQTSDFFISKENKITNIDYTIVPIKMLENIRTVHPDYLNKYF